LVQATFLTAIERAESYDESRPLVPWLLGVLALHARKQRECASRELDPERVSQRASDPPDARASSRELVAAVERAVETMPATYASVVLRHLVEGAGPGEIAGELGITPANARVRLHRGLKLLRAAIPSGFAGAGAGWLATWRSLRDLKREVLARASAKTGARSRAASRSRRSSSRRSP
jgi:RNA polymerase sigma-70 factor (ECF subfamily)